MNFLSLFNPIYQMRVEFDHQLQFSYCLTMNFGYLQICFSIHIAEFYGKKQFFQSMISQICWHLLLIFFKIDLFEYSFWSWYNIRYTFWRQMVSNKLFYFITSSFDKFFDHILTYRGLRKNIDTISVLLSKY